jgi:hypothetical protein
MKKNGLLFSLLFAATLFFGCSPSDEDMLKKYEGYAVVTPQANRSGVRIENFSGFTDIFQVEVAYTHLLIKEYVENISLLSERFIALNAENLADTLPINITVGKQTSTNYSPSGEVTASGMSYLTVINFGETKAKYVLIGFKGIDAKESGDLSTPACFFLVSLEKDNPHVLTAAPLLAGDKLFDTEYTSTYFRRYEGILNAGNKTFHIRIGETGVSEDGNTFVDFHSKEIKEEEWSLVKLPVNDWETSIGEFLTEIVVSGRTVYPAKYAVGNGILRHGYKTKKMPDLIKVKYPGGNHVVFDGKTKEVLFITRN